MCLRLKYAEALQWKKKAREILDKAREAGKANPCDPLFLSNPRLSALVSEVDSIKKRHGLLIEDALIYAINLIPGWVATKKEKITVASGKAHLDCLAYNSKSRVLYVFECKRGHGNFDRDKTRAFDQRLDQIGAVIAAHAKASGWNPVEERLFILSFYGKKWKSKYQIYDSGDIASLFEPCLGTFVNQYMRHIEDHARDAYSQEKADSSGQSSISPAGEENAGRRGTIFDRLDERDVNASFDIEFGPESASLVPAQSYS
jgi:hypothetical protein